MSTSEDRIAALERKVAALELRRMYDESRTQQNVPSELGQNLREINENMTILLGVIGEQGQDIKTIKENVATMATKEDVATLQGDVTALKGDVATLRGDITTLDERVLSAFQQLLTVIDQRLPPQEK